MCIAFAHSVSCLRMRCMLHSLCVYGVRACVRACVYVCVRCAQLSVVELGALKFFQSSFLKSASKHITQDTRRNRFVVAFGQYVVCTCLAVWLAVCLLLCAYICVYVVASVLTALCPLIRSQQVRDQLQIKERFLPQLFLVDRDGLIRWRAEGRATDEETAYMVKNMQRLIAEPA